jgi:nucleoside-diphosphate-sugar epimerase
VALQTEDLHQPLEESDLGGMPDATYGWVKLTGERLAAEANAEGIKTFVFRPFSGYGEDQAFDYPFPAIVRRALLLDEDAEEFPVWGHPGSVRDWVHIDDVVGCVLAALDDDVIGPMNICTGIPTTFTELATKVLLAVGRDLPVVGDTTKPAGVFWRQGDPSLMRQIYRPLVSLEEGIELALRTLGLCPVDPLLSRPGEG